MIKKTATTTTNTPFGAQFGSMTKKKTPEKVNAPNVKDALGKIDLAKANSRITGIIEKICGCF